MDLAWILASLSRFWEMSVLWKKSFFCIFSCPHQKKIQVAANRTILKIDAFHIAHFEAYVPLFSKHLWKLTIPQKLWVSALFEVGWSRTVAAKIGVFRPLFWRKCFVSSIWPHKHPQVLYMVGKLRICSLWWKKENIFFSLCEASDFRGCTRTDFQTLAETAS